MWGVNCGIQSERKLNALQLKRENVGKTLFKYECEKRQVKLVPFDFLTTWRIFGKI